MNTSKSTDLEVISDEGHLQSFFLTQFLTNSQKQIVALESLDKKLYVLIKKTEELISSLSPNVPEYEVEESAS